MRVSCACAWVASAALSEPMMLPGSIDAVVRRLLAPLLPQLALPPLDVVAAPDAPTQPCAAVGAPGVPLTQETACAAAMSGVLGAGTAATVPVIAKVLPGCCALSCPCGEQISALAAPGELSIPSLELLHSLRAATAAAGSGVQGQGKTGRGTCALCQESGRHTHGVR